MKIARARLLALLSASLLLAGPAVRAGSATWTLNPTSNDWNTAANWNPATVPNGSRDIATFAVSNTSAVSLSGSVVVDRMIFNQGASGYTVTVGTGTGQDNLTLSGLGVVNNSGRLQNFVVTSSPVGQLIFTGTATAGVMTILTNKAGGNGGLTPGEMFMDNSSAAYATFITEGSLSGNAFRGEVQFFGNSTGGNATFMSEPGGLVGGFVGFYENSTAGEGTYTCEGGTAGQHVGGQVVLNGNSSGSQGTFIANGTDVLRATGGAIQCIGFASADDATFIANGGQSAGGLISYGTGSLGGSARIEVFGNGRLDTSLRNGVAGYTIGSLEGDGLVFLGSVNLEIGHNSLSTLFTGIIADGGACGGEGGSLTKVGGTSLELSGASTYTGGTGIVEGTLIVSNTTGSATGSGVVQVASGTLGGSGVIAGSVVLGIGGGASFLAPAHGTNRQATLTIGSTLIFNSNSSYVWTFKAQRNKAKTDVVVANGVTINTGAVLTLKGQIRGSLAQDTVLTLIKNTAATPIAGTFSNLSDGAIVNVNGNNLQASYAGGDGNDLTLTVVP